MPHILEHPAQAGLARSVKFTENGQRLKSNYSSEWSRKKQFDSGVLHFVSRIRDNRYVAVDQERAVRDGLRLEHVGRGQSDRVRDVTGVK